MSIIDLINLAHKTFIACSEEFRYMALLLASLVYIYCVGKNKTVRRMSYIGMGAIVLFFFPPLIKWGISCFSEYGYETLLLIPANILIAYTVVSVYNEAKERRQKGMWAFFCCIMLLLSGKYAYSQIYAAGLLENNYYVNSEYMDVCSVIPLERSCHTLAPKIHGTDTRCAAESAASAPDSETPYCPPPQEAPGTVPFPGAVRYTEGRTDRRSRPPALWTECGTASHR